MKLSVFLEDIKQNQEEVVFYCCNHLLSKKFDITKDDIEEENLKNLFINYDNFAKALNDSAGIIYKKICELFNESFDNVYLFKYRLARVVNQEPKQFIDIQDKDTQQTVIQKFEDKINLILQSKYYKENEDTLSKEMIIPQKTLELIKSVANL